jgi:hypothetical protein
VPYNGRKIFFDQDYTSSKRRTSKLKIFPAKLKIYLDSGTKTLTDTWRVGCPCWARRAGEAPGETNAE